MLYDVRTLNHHGVWQTDTVTGSRERATDRAKYLIGHVPAVEVKDGQGRRVDLVGA